MVQRRDHLLAVRARLLALSSLTVATPNNNGSQIGIVFRLSNLHSQHLQKPKQLFTNVL